MSLPTLLTCVLIWVTTDQHLFPSGTLKRQEEAVLMGCEETGRVQENAPNVPLTMYLLLGVKPWNIPPIVWICWSEEL